MKKMDVHYCIVTKLHWKSIHNRACDTEGRAPMTTDAEKVTCKKCLQIIDEANKEG